jgi:hypothetical protein
MIRFTAHLSNKVLNGLFQLKLFLKMKLNGRTDFGVEEIPLPDYITENYTGT